MKVQGGILDYSSLILNSVLAQIFIFPTCKTVGSGSCAASTSAGMMKMSEVLTWDLVWIVMAAGARYNERVVAHSL